MSTAPAIDSAFVAQLAAQVASMQQQIHALQAQVAELQAERQPSENGNGHPKAPPPPAAAPMAAARGPSSQLRERSGSTNRFFERTPTQVAEEEPPPPPPPPMPPFARVESTEVSPDKAKSSSVLSSGKLPASRRMHLPQTTDVKSSPYRSARVSDSPPRMRPSAADDPLSRDEVVVREGFLCKEGHLLKTWKRRWFQLTSWGVLKYYEDEFRESSHTASLVKTDQGLGMRLTPENVVTGLDEDSQAELSGEIRVGDQVLALNGTPLGQGVTVSSVVAALPRGAQCHFELRRRTAKGSPIDTIALGGCTISEPTSRRGAYPFAFRLNLESAKGEKDKYVLSGLNAQDSNEWRSAIMQCAPLTSQQGQSRLAAENEHIDLVFGGGGGDGLRTPPSPTQSGGGLGRRRPPQLWRAQSGEI